MAASWMDSRSPTSVITQRLWSASISRSSRYTPGTFIAATMASTLALSRPSEKLGTHSTSVDIRDKHNGHSQQEQICCCRELRAGAALNYNRGMDSLVIARR